MIEILEYCSARVTEYFTGGDIVRFDFNYLVAIVTTEHYYGARSDAIETFPKCTLELSTRCYRVLAYQIMHSILLLYPRDEHLHRI
jgi:hypothetical protein